MRVLSAQGQRYVALAFTEHLNCMPHTWLGIFIHLILTIAPSKWISCLPFTDKFGFQILTQRHGAMMWGDWGETETLRPAVVAELTGPSSGLQTSHGRPGFFHGASLFQLAVVFPLELAAGHEQQGECYKNRVWYKWTRVCESFLSKGTTNQAQGSIDFSWVD